MRASTRRPAPRASRVPFAAVCCALIAVTMAALLALNIASAQASYSQDALQARLSRIGEEQQALRERLESAQAPDALEREATSMGLVRSGGTAFLSLGDGAVLGDPAPAPEPTPEPTPAPTSSPTDPTGTAGPTAADGGAAAQDGGAPRDPGTPQPPADGQPTASAPPTAEGGQP